LLERLEDFLLLLGRDADAGIRHGETQGDLAAGTPHDMPVHDATATPRSFGDYELLEEIAEVGMGGVYKVRCRHYGTTLASSRLALGKLELCME
jgi:hypothetical protein